MNRGIDELCREVWTNSSCRALPLLNLDWRWRVSFLMHMYQPYNCSGISQIVYFI